MENLNIKNIKKENKKTNKKLFSYIKQLYKTLLDSNNLEYAVKVKMVLKNLKKYPNNKELLTTVKSINEYINTIKEDFTKCFSLGKITNKALLSKVVNDIDTIAKLRRSLNGFTKQEVGSFAFVEGLRKYINQLKAEIEKKHKIYLDKFSDQNSLEYDDMDELSARKELDSLQNRVTRLKKICTDRIIIESYKKELNNQLEYGNLTDEEAQNYLDEINKFEEEIYVIKTGTEDTIKNSGNSKNSWLNRKNNYTETKENKSTYDSDAL